MKPRVVFLGRHEYDRWRLVFGGVWFLNSDVFAFSFLCSEHFAYIAQHTRDDRVNTILTVTQTESVRSTPVRHAGAPAVCTVAVLLVLQNATTQPT